MSSERLRFAVDPEHGGFRLAITLLLLALFVLFYFVISLILPQLGALLTLLASGALAYLIGAQVERALRRRWPSGRALEVDVSGVRLLRHDQIETAVDVGADVELLRWRFEVRGRARVPKGWLMVACALQQDDRMIAAYTLMPPKRLETLPGRERFTLLTSEKKGTQPAQGDLRLAGEQRRLRAAETHRWQNGAEMTNDDFEQYVARVAAMFAR